MSLQLIEAEDGQQQIDDAAFAASYEGWALRNDISLPDEQLKLICGIWFNRGIRRGEESAREELSALENHIENLKFDMASMMTESTDDDGLSERKRLGGCYHHEEVF